MGLPFFDSGSRKRPDQMLAVDLGSRITKAVHLQRRGESFALCSFALLDAPIFEKTLSAEMLTEHLQAVCQALQAKTKSVTLTVGVNDALVRHVEMPRIPVDEMRLMLKHNSKNYLQQDLSNYVFDCQAMPARSDSKPDPAKGFGGQQKQKTLVVGAKKQLVDDYVAGARSAGLTVDFITPGLVGPVNAFEMAMPEVFAQEVVALVDIGFRCSSICILQEGELVLSRVVAIGGDRLTSALSESMNISYAEAESIKIGMAAEVQTALDTIVIPLGRELRASIDFFENQHDHPVGRAFITGGSACSDLIVQTLQNELMIECKTWDPTASLQMSLATEQTDKIEQAAPQLAVALGAALAALRPA